MFKLGAMEQYIENLPEDIQLSVLLALKKERDRWEREDLTPTEKAFEEMVFVLGQKMAQKIDEEILSILTPSMGA